MARDTQLHHTNIVPVFGVGCHEGTHYYVMQFIQGLGLDEVLAELKRLRRVKEPAASRGEQVPASGAEAPSAVGFAKALLTGQFRAPPSGLNASLVAEDAQAEVAGPTIGIGPACEVRSEARPSSFDDRGMGSSGTENRHKQKILPSRRRPVRR